MRPLRSAVVLVLVLFLSIGCSSTVTSTSAPTALDRIKQRGELVVGTAASMPPLNMTTKSGEIIGLEADMARAMADAMNVKLRLAPTPFADLLPALAAGSIDVIISGMTMTPERNMSVAFVGPYFISGKSFLTTTATLTNRGSAEGNDPAMRIAVLRASTSETFVQQTIPKATIVPTKDYDEAIALVSQGKADIMIADMPACVVTVARYPDRGLFALATPLTREPIGIALPANDPLLVNWTQNWLREMEAGGNLELMKDLWFKNTVWLKELP